MKLWNKFSFFMSWSNICWLQFFISDWKDILCEFKDLWIKLSFFFSLVWSTRRSLILFHREYYFLVITYNKINHFFHLSSPLMCSSITFCLLFSLELLNKKKEKLQLQRRRQKRRTPRRRWKKCNPVRKKKRQL